MKRLVEYTKKQPEKVQNKIMLIAAGSMTLVIAGLALLLQRNFGEPRDLSFDATLVADFKQQSQGIFDDLNASFEDAGDVIREARQNQAQLGVNPPIEKRVRLAGDQTMDDIQKIEPSIRVVKEEVNDIYVILVDEGVEISLVGLELVDDADLEETDIDSVINN